MWKKLIASYIKRKKLKEVIRVTPETSFPFYLIQTCQKVAPIVKHNNIAQKSSKSSWKYYPNIRATPAILGNESFILQYSNLSNNPTQSEAH